MRIISERAIREFQKKHSDSVESLKSWLRVVRHADWKTGADVKANIPSSDQVGEKTIFNIAMNRYRLIAFIDFRAHIVYIKAILTHKEYDKENWKK